MKRYFFCNLSSAFMNEVMKPWKAENTKTSAAFSCLHAPEVLLFYIVYTPLPNCLFVVVNFYDCHSSCLFLLVI
ncbi:hypothetical protein, unlikely [Trypanosoma brucei gambiense DAL972]|uniref:Uncharacterized protein n=3 Tax=Trypanosoma brucei TaxID=5691 RepID=Q4GYA3_TRYB2|nr:hypothetical protein, unlikely [Trypanosoma brucei brucei TREU927]XP_011771603.1 hypothetical protein, unlikely [Trypanosoma brucei gambiense DAL972]RHW74239.1 hypothetical protein DPX39_010045900 [Trypanosoma brucei equiperdum]CAJ16681.1 hypothetical protein, unlikely [Trypanosoma brucei brucei TREU927]CBH09162.1 hypothetical protein, unlikely [Trypanosoma brucei gambiense DAL972]|eukprot:XP_011771603.1 hypothetical protein, unlikely [Trypanosoma brucei gambiense DAL972]